MKHNIIGKFVTIKDKYSLWNGEWGIVKFVDGDYIYVAIANDESSMPVFTRDQIKVRRK